MGGDVGERRVYDIHREVKYNNNVNPSLTFNRLLKQTAHIIQMNNEYKL